MFKTYKHETAANRAKDQAARALFPPYRAELQRDVSIMRRVLEETSSEPSKYLPSTIPSITPLSERYRQCAWAQARPAWLSYLAQIENIVRKIIRDSPSLTDHERSTLFRVNKRHAWYASSLTLDWSLDEKGEYCYPRKSDPHKISVPVDQDLLFLARRLVKHARKHRVAPRLDHVKTMRLNANVASVSDAVTSTRYGKWVKLATLDKGHPVLIPLEKNSYHDANMAMSEERRSIQLSVKEGRVTVGIVREEPDAELRAERDTIGLDWGICSMFATSDGRLYGRVFMDWLRDADEQIEHRRAECVKLRIPLKTDPEYQRLNKRVRDRVKNETGRIVNILIRDDTVSTLAVEDLDFRGGGLSRRMNRILTRAGRGAVRAKLDRIIESHGIRVDKVNPAYTSQECSKCGYVDKRNRSSQSRFKCQYCGHSVNADVNAARVIKGRSLDQCEWPYVKRSTILLKLQQHHAAVARERPWSYRGHGTAPSSTPPLSVQNQ